MASSLKAELEREFPGIKVALKESGGGVFEVTVDGQLVFSKKKLKRFPEDGEVPRLIKSKQPQAVK